MYVINYVIVTGFFEYKKLHRNNLSNSFNFHGFSGNTFA